MTTRAAEPIFAISRAWMVHAVGYLSAGALLHAITVVEVAIILFITSRMGPHPLENPALLMLCLFPLFTQLDARSRFQEYKQVKDQLIRYGPDRRIFRPVSSSRCQRDAALAAAKQLGYATHCRIYFTAAGYRWYHLLPDFLKKHPGFLFSTAFWRTTFFTPGYHNRCAVPINTHGLGTSIAPRRKNPVGISLHHRRGMAC